MELNVHRILEIVMRGTSDPSSRFASLRDAIVRVARDAHDDAHAAMLVRAPFFLRLSTSTNARVTPQIKKAARDLVDLMRPSIERAIRGGVCPATHRMTAEGVLIRLGDADHERRRVRAENGDVHAWSHPTPPGCPAVGGVGECVVATMDELVASIGCERIERGYELREAVQDYARGCYSRYGPISFWDVWGLRSMQGAFESFGCAADLYWATHHVERLTRAFANSDFTGKIGHLDVSSVQYMDEAFASNAAFNQPLDRWDVSRCRSMAGMFRGARAFNRPLSSWNVRNVTDMSDMFNGATMFNMPLDTWRPEHVEKLTRMFHGALSFNQPLDSWDVTRGVICMNRMFYNTPSFNQRLDKWMLEPTEPPFSPRAVSGPADIDTRFMFHGSAYDGPIGQWVLSGPGPSYGRRLLEGVVVGAGAPDAPYRSDDEIHADPDEFTRWHDRNTVSFIRPVRDYV
jgi:surface protein